MDGNIKTKAFISHRGTQKESFVAELIKLVGQHKCIYDSYNFQSGSATIEAIDATLPECGLFVALISKDYPGDSEITKYELKCARELAKLNKITILPLIIDASLDWRAAPEWITGEFSLTVKLATTPHIAAQRINEAIRLLVSQTDPGEPSSLFGREAALSNVKSKINRSRGGNSPYLGLVVSGHPGIGRGTFLRGVISSLRLQHETGPLIKLHLRRGDSIQEFGLALSQILSVTKDDQDRFVTMSPDNQTEEVAKNIKAVSEQIVSLRIKDEGCIVNFKGEIAPWFRSLLRNAGLPPRLHLFISSSYNPLYKETEPIDNVIWTKLSPLDASARTDVLIDMLRRRGFDIGVTEELETIANKLRSNLRQLSKAADLIVDEGVEETRRQIATLKNGALGAIGAILKPFRERQEGKEILELFSELNMLSLSMLKSLYEEGFEKIAEELALLERAGVVYRFGANEDLYSLTLSFYDALRNTRASLSKEKQKKLRTLLMDEVNDFESKALDPAQYMGKLIYMLRNPKSLNQEDNPYLMPSIVQAEIERQYDEGNYERVIDICRKALELVDSYQPESLQGLYYRYCQSLARRATAWSLRDDIESRGDLEDTFFTYIDYIEDKADKHFLKGFYFRLKNNASLLDNAQNHLETALRISPKMRVARRELVEVLYKKETSPGARPWQRRISRRNLLIPFTSMPISVASS